MEKLSVRENHGQDALYSFVAGIDRPSKPELNRLWASTAPSDPGVLLAPTSATDPALMSESRLRVVKTVSP